MTRTAILYQNQARNVTLIDVPTSISQAQNTSDCPHLDKIYSSPALKSPHTSLEPKSQKARANVLRMNGPGEDYFPRDLLYQALTVIQEHWKADWCLEREILPQVRGSVKKRKGDNEFIGTSFYKPTGLEASHNKAQTTNAWEPLDLAAGGVDRPQADQVVNRVVHNSSADLNRLHFQNDAQYRIPPSSSFLCSTINLTNAMSFSMAALHRYPSHSQTTSAGSGQFDLLLLDPPWANRSVWRANEYGIPASREHPMDVLRSMLEQHIAPGGLVGCWITNKASVRDKALKCFRDFGAELTEEWAWLKVTVNGVPVTEIDGLWRKPYEVLLIGRKKSTETAGGFRVEGKPKAVQRRVIAAVPDLHSRKPNMKELIEPMIQGFKPYRVAEIFARNLTAGWWSWGDEVLKYQWDGYWSKDETNLKVEM